MVVTTKKRNSKREQIRDYAELVASQMLLWAQKKYKLPNKINDLTLITAFDSRRVYSYGGWHKTKTGHYRPYLNLSLANCLRFKPQIISEYDWYKDDPVIGQRLANTWKYYVRFLVAHEVSHILDLMSHFVYGENKQRLQNRFGRSNLADEGHGETFQRIYRVLRRKYVNRVKKLN